MSMLNGRLAVYGVGQHGIKLCAFESYPDAECCLVLIGGLTDGLMSLEYCVPLSKALHRLKISLVQPLLSSSYCSYGTSSLHQDCTELDMLFDYLQSTGYKKIYLMGHSTGCQDIVYWSKHTKQSVDKSIFKGAILQAPTSDRLLKEKSIGPGPLRELLDLSHTLIGSDRFMPRFSEDGIAITPERFVSLYNVGGEDDLFSPDLPLSRWKENFECLSMATLVFYSENDETVPYFDRYSMESIKDKFEKAVSFLHEFVIIPNANHSVSNVVEELDMFLERIVLFIEKN